MDEIILFTIKQHIGNKIKFSMHDKIRRYVVVVFDNEPLSAGVTQLHARLCSRAID